MLKLIKHNIKESFLEIVVLNGIMLVLSFLCVVVIRLRIDFLAAIFLLAWVAVFYAIFFILVKNIIKSFHTDIFTSRGYLTLTTPVSIDKILLAKILVNMMWVLFTALIFIASIFIAIETMFGHSFALGVIFQAIWDLVVINPFGFIKVVLYIVVYILSFVMMLLLTLILINTGRVKKYKTLIGVLMYIAISITVTRIGAFVVALFNSSEALVLSSLLFSVAVYFLSRYVIANKLELE